MTDIEIFETEIKCIQRRSSGQCNGGSDCCNCDLLMSDEEIISAYERAIEQNDIINRQKAEIERLKNDCFCIANERDAIGDCMNEAVEEAKAEAIKEFAEDFEEEFFVGGVTYSITKEEFDEFIKRKVGEGV